MEKRIHEQYIAMVLKNILTQNKENIEMDAIVNRAIADKISTNSINTKVNSKLNAITAEIRNINPKYNEDSKDYASTKAEILDALTGYEAALLELSDFYDEKIELLILDKVKLESKKLGLIIKDECLSEAKEQKNIEKESFTSKVAKGVKDLVDKINFKNSNKEKEYIDVSLYSQAQDIVDIQSEVNEKMGARVVKAQKESDDNAEKIKNIEVEIKKIDLEINRLNKIKEEKIMQAMETGDKWIAVSIKKPKLMFKVKRFFLSKFNAKKLINKNVIVPLNNLVKEFRETELVNIKG